MHESTTPSGIFIPDPDQGVPYVHIQCAMPSTALMVFEPFSAEEIAEHPQLEKCGHNLEGFAQRWHAWMLSRDPFLEAIDVRFGYPKVIPRACIPQAVEFSIQYHRKEDVRAMHRGGLLTGRQPRIRQRGNGVIEIDVPR